MRLPSRFVRALGVVALGGLATANAFAASAAYEPPKFSYGDGRVDLLEAVRLTLAHDPNLLLDREDVRFRQGVLQEISGAFDWTLSAGLSYNYREQELRDSTVAREKEKRNDLMVQRDFACAEADRQQVNLDNLIAFAGGNTGVDIPIDIRQQIDFLDGLIAAEDNPVQRQALLTARSRVLDAAIEQGTDGVAEFQQFCVDLGESLDRLGPIPEFEEFAQGQFSLELNKLFRTGVAFSPFVDANYDHTQFVGPYKTGFFEDRLDENGDPVVTELGTPIRRFVDFGGKNIADLYRVEVGFDVNFPLLRGRGVESVAAPERSAEVDLQASELALRHGASLSTLNTVLSYWQLYAAQERVAVLQHSVELQTRLLDLTEQLIEGEVLPRVERARSLAGQANAQAQLEAASRDLISARLALARAMGVDVESQDNAPLAAGPFPEAPAAEALQAIDLPELVAEAPDRRDDRNAALTLVESGKILSVAAQRDLKDRFDVGLSLSAGALGENSFGKATDRWSGPNGSLSVAYEHVIGNNSRLGRLGQTESLVRQREISAGDLERNIRISVVQTVRSLQEAVARLASAESAAEYFQQTIDAEFEKLKLGASTLIDAIVTEQQKTGSDLSVLTARQQVANLLAQLRFETGTLVEGREGGGSVTFESMTQLPQLDGGQP